MNNRKYSLKDCFVRLTEITLMFMTVSVANASDMLAHKDLEWELQKDEAGIQVYFSHIEDSDIKAFMGKTIMSASASSILKVMKDASACKDWIWGCLDAENIKEVDYDEFYRYGINHLSWPANDRDYVNHIKVNHIKTSHNQDTGYFSISIKAVEGFVPPTKKNVRLKKMNIEYTLKPLSASETEVIWFQHTEPGGYIPDWLVNMLLIDIPYYSLTRLENVAQRSKYASAQFIYDENNEIRGVE